jgi:predicted nucleic acid-binding protein
VAVGGAAIFDEYERKVREIGRRLNPNVRDTDVQQLRREAEAVYVAGSPSFNPEDSPSFTRDRKDDPIVYTALLGHADYLISDDHDIVPDGSEQAYEHDEHQILAVTFNRFVTTYFEPTDLDWGRDRRPLATTRLQRPSPKYINVVAISTQHPPIVWAAARSCCPNPRKSPYHPQLSATAQIGRIWLARAISAPLSLSPGRASGAGGRKFESCRARSRSLLPDQPASPSACPSVCSVCGPSRVFSIRPSAPTTNVLGRYRSP